MSTTPSKVEHFGVGWITALDTEYIVACEMLDQEYPPLPMKDEHDNNTYTFGRIAHHNVIIACLPKGTYGISSSTSVAKDMLRSFPNVRFGLLVGIGGGAPNAEHDIRLGDVVVSSPDRRSGGVIHYAFGKTIQNKKLQLTGALPAPPVKLRTALTALSASHGRKGHNISHSISQMIERNGRLKKKYQCPGRERDLLYSSTFVHHDSGQSCETTCAVSSENVVTRKKRGADDLDPDIHYGLIASADQLMKDAQARDTLAKDEGVLCFEMEAAGLTEHFPCLVIRGVCDYSDTHKNDLWQGYAAATAAAYAKELLSIVPATDVSSMPTVEGPGSLQHALQTLPTQVQHRMWRDSKYNKLRVDDQTGAVHISMPRFPEQVFQVDSDYVSSAENFSGSSAFSLADLLKLLPHQKNSNWAHFDDLALHSISYDERTYYSQVSRRGLLKFITDHFASITEENGLMIVSTDVGTFTFETLGASIKVNLQSQERSGERMILAAQDFQDVQKSARGQYRLFAENAIQQPNLWVENILNPERRDRFWSDPMSIDVAALAQNHDFPDCIRFTSPADHGELLFLKRFASDLVDLMCRRVMANSTVPWMAMSLQLIQALNAKRFLTLENLRVAVGAGQLILGEARDNLPGRTSPTTQDETLDLIFDADRFMKELLELYTPHRSRIAIQNRLLECFSNEPNLVVMQAGLGILIKAHTDFILSKTVKAPDRWIRMITGADVDILLG